MLNPVTDVLARKKKMEMHKHVGEKAMWLQRQRLQRCSCKPWSTGMAGDHRKQAEATLSFPGPSEQVWPRQYCAFRFLAFITVIE